MTCKLRHRHQQILEKIAIMTNFKINNCRLLGSVPRRTDNSNQFKLLTSFDWYRTQLQVNKNLIHVLLIL